MEDSIDLPTADQVWEREDSQKRVKSGEQLRALKQCLARALNSRTRSFFRLSPYQSEIKYGVRFDYYFMEETLPGILEELNAKSETREYFIIGRVPESVCLDPNCADPDTYCGHEGNIQVDIRPK